LRADMVQKLADLKPGFMRFPGGCIVEGSQLDRRYQWKNTIGPIEERKLLINRWNYEFIHRPTPDYFQSFGLGFFEFFQLCEDIGSEPLPILNCGMACQFNSGELCPLDQLEPFIQDALDLVEFANGPADSPWGAKRAAMGHPEPFHLKMMGVGNEQWGPQYIERYARFAKALKAKYPDLMLVSAAGPSPDDERFQFLWPKLRELNADIVDEHCYANPSWFFTNTHRYDHYDRNGPKVFMGEYAAQSVAVVSVKNRNTLECALAEAAYMTGLERNADVVRMASYAPLFANSRAWQWTPNLIWVNSLQSFGTPNYYAQMLFSRNRASVVLPISCVDAASGSEAANFYVAAARDDLAGEIIIKAVNPSQAPVEAAIQLEGVAGVGPTAQSIVLASGSLDDQNSFEDPVKVSPKTTQLGNVHAQFDYTFPAYSLTVLRIPATEK
jgi:alpha-L-arabinofuranosidase